MTRINPLSRRPRSRRLVVAVRGAAGTGKSHFAASLADAGLGRLCLFDTERKSRLMPGADGSRFDALEIEHPDELPEFVEWALTEGREQQGYGCFALDSWALYFGRKHRATIEAARRRAGDPTAQPSAEALQADQVVLQEVLRRLCVDSGACVVITDQIAARGQQDREENEFGRVLPMTASGLEYFVDVMLELDLRVDGFETRRVATVVKSNAPALPVGTEFADPTFADVLARLGEAPQPAEVPGMLDAPTSVEAPPQADEAALMAAAEAYGIGREQVVLAARHYCGTGDLGHLRPDQIETLLGRMHVRYGADRAPTGGDGAAQPADARVARRTSRSSSK